MRYVFSLLVLLALILGAPAALPVSADQPDVNSMEVGPRLVVFESFYSLT